MSKTAQITVFIIIGVVVLFMFFFLMMLASSMQKTKLADTQERIVTSLISKEAFRLYVEDCLSDALEEGLILLGQQGRIWSDQPGGRISFDEQRTGIIWSGNRTAYGITFDTFSEPNSYPCNKASSAPEFCQYTYPDTSLGFGQLEFKPQTLENDLKLYLVAQTVSCVENFTKTNISSSAKLTSTELKLALDLREEGINVQVEYPLSFTIGQEVFFYLSEFDFFYETNFKQLLDAAVVYPLQFDSRYLDFDYSEETLNTEQFTYASKTFAENCQPLSDHGQNYYACSRNSFADIFANLQIRAEKFSLANGDDIFVFTAPDILHNQEQAYEFRIARQNRPPALDHVQRMACPAAGYDYLVIPNDEELGSINLSLFALDPDEDTVNYSFDHLPSQLTDAEPNDNLLFVDRARLQNYPSKIYNLTARSSDGNLEDNQTVRILIDKPLDLSVSLNLPYQVALPNGTVLPYAEFLKISQRYFVTIEDPVFININLPSLSLDHNVLPEITLNYTNPSSPSDSFEYILPDSIYFTGSSGCFSLPWLKGCNLDSYKSTPSSYLIIRDWDYLMAHPSTIQSLSLSGDFSHFKALTTLPSKLNLTINLNYCGYNNKSDSKVVEVEVKQCIPHQNPEHPYAYPYQNYEFGLDAAGKTDLTAFKGGQTEINPFLATHSCCGTDWKILESKECFVDPQPRCYGGMDFTNGNKGYILEEQYSVCDGKRGNLCGEDSGKQYRLPRFGSESQLLCGSRSLGCTNVAPKCEGKKAWSYIDTDNNNQLDSWCHGAMGCQLCSNIEVVAVDATSPQFFDINALALGKVLAGVVPGPVNNQNVGFACGCQRLGQFCDKNYDGNFKGVCQLKSCASSGTCEGSTLECSEAN